ncbi:MAG TPA: biopolymer transporter ExbD [Gemmatimonadales bacterium]|nr:biopolymer transporter ExbD [Gemmatimonadales bacterium]HRZ08823.1 biopolymer transporter ExbD [Gemmatimonadales bacterium]
MAISTGSGRGKVNADINVTPMIDVMLVLLIIFMIVTPLIAAGFQATLPKGKNLDPSPEEDTDVILGIDRNGKFFLDTKPIDEAVLEDYLRTVYAARTEDKILYFKADNNLKYGRVQDAVELARRAGVRVLAAITEPQNTGLLAHEEEK